MSEDETAEKKAKVPTYLLEIPGMCVEEDSKESREEKEKGESKAEVPEYLFIMPGM